MSINWTNEQLRAINSRGKHILVSASAGSGKTSVMTERVLSLIAEGYTLDQMLIVTFTRASASDMKEKLAGKIIESNNPLVKKQIERLAQADICTLHSFCQKLISTYFYAVGVDPEYTVLEDSSALLNQSIDVAIKEFLQNPSDDFLQLNEIFTDSRSDFKLKNLVAEFVLSAQSGQYKKDKINPEFELIRMLSARRKQLMEKANILSIRTKQAGFSRNYDAVDNFSEYLRHWQVPQLARGKIEPQFITLNEDLKELKKSAVNLIDDYQRVKSATSQSKQYLDVLHSLTSRTQEIFASLKQEKSKLDFCDLENYALKVICSQAGEQIREKYKFIFVDEYQDINPIQDQIIQSLKGNNYLFLVGDIKQSIYAFRGCEPDIFLAKREEFMADDDKELIELNLNHRSLDCILGFANNLFSSVMVREFGGVDYSQDAKFILTGKAGGAVRLHCVDEDEISADNNIDNINNSTIGNSNNNTVNNINNKDDCTQNPKSQPQSKFDKIYNITKHEKAPNAQAEQVAQCVLDILHNESITENGKTRPVKRKDIAILCRGNSDTVTAIHSRLLDLNVPAVFSQDQDDDGIYANALINYLRYISNPLNDQTLINALKSYFGGFSDQDLAKIRIDYPKEEYFYQSAYKHKSTAEFFERAEHYRKLSPWLSVSELCGLIVSDFEYFAYLFAKGTHAVRQLEKFLEDTQMHDGESLYEFLEDAKGSPIKEVESDAVSIMTIHASKGLEFPFVILIDVQKRFNLGDLYDPILIFQGRPAIKHYDYANRCESDSKEWLYNYFSMLHRRKEEELRLLYVAITRAKYRLDIFSAQKYKESSEYFDSVSAGSYFAWLAPFCALNRPKSPQNAMPVPKTSQRVVPNSDKTLVEELKKRFISPKITQKPLSKSYVTALIENKGDDDQYKPIFAHDDRAVERGNMYHKAMELVNFEKELNWDTMSDEIKANVDVDDIQTCVNTIKELTAGKQYYKEKGFMLNEDNMLVQGIIDLLIVDKNEAIVLDYKSGGMHESYKNQLEYYAKAVEKILGLKVTKKLIYSFVLKKLIEV